MKKRILSLFLAIFVLLAAMPGTAVFAEDAVTEDTTVSDDTVSEESGAVEAEINLTEPDFPEKVTTFKPANNFPDEAGTFKALCANQASDVPWDPGVITDASSYASVSGGTTTISNGWATFTEGEEKGTFTTQMVFKSQPESDTNFITVDVDATGITDSTSKMSARLYMGMSSGSNTMYATAGQTYYYLPKATEDNPNPTMQTRTMSSSSNNYSATFYVYPGDQGTFYFPETLFLVSDEIANQNNSGAEWVTNGVGDFSKYMADEWRLWHASGKYKSNCIYFQFRSCIPANNSIAFGNVRWMSENAFSLDYNAEYVAEDFSDAESAQYTYWSDDYNVTADNFSVTDGAFKHTVTADNWTDETKAFRYGFTVGLDYPVNSAFEALMYDVDYSSLTNAPSLQITYNVKNTDVSKTAYVRRFIVSGSTINAVWENGVVEDIVVTSGEWPWITLPVGFKGTLVIPFEAFKNLTAGNYTYDGTSTDLYKTDDINDYSVTIDMRNIDFSDKDEVVSYDNFGYLTTLGPVNDEGTIFNADAPVETAGKIKEDINTVEAWVNIPVGTAEGTILADKYRISNTTATDSVVLTMNASGNPSIYISDGDGNAVTLTADTVDLRTARWTHIAFVKNTEAGTLNCYINGMLKCTAVLPEGFGEVTPYHTLTVGHYIHDELGSATFGGEISSLKLWNKSLTSSEILSSAIGETKAAAGLISAWTLSGANGYIDAAGNYDLRAYDLYTTAEDEAYSEYSSIPENGYTMVVLPDTQIAAQREAVTGDSTGFSDMYDWIVENKDAQNIKFVMGVGDITNKDAAAEYILARENFDKLSDAGIPWSIVGGNHDFAGGSVAPNNTTNLNTYFPADELSEYEGFGGVMTDGKIDNSYYYVTVNETKYLILNLMCEPYDSTLEWASQVCQKNKDCKVIVITHEYITNDGEFFAGGYTGRNHGIDVWNELVSQHENIIMAIGGHISVADIQYNEAYGVNGNKVINVLVDGQALDWKNPSYNMLMFLKFSADGSKVTFNYYSPTRDAYIDWNNQFTLEVDGVVSDETVPSVPVSDFSYTGYHSGEMIRDYEWIVRDDGKLGIWSDSKHSTVGISNFTWYNNMLKFTAPSEFLINPDTVTEESEGSAYASDRVGITIDDLPNVVNAQHTAISLYVDHSNATSSAGLRLRFNSGSAAYETYNGSVVYRVDESGNVKKVVCTGTHSTVSIPAGFKGSVIVPFSSFRNASDKTAATAADMLKTEQSNSAHLVVYVLEAKPAEEYIFGNVCYLEEYEANDMAQLRKFLLGAEDGVSNDVNSDEQINIMDLIRLKKLLAQAYIK